MQDLTIVFCRTILLVALTGCRETAGSPDAQDDPDLHEDSLDEDTGCSVAPGTAPDFVESIMCLEDFEALSCTPLEASIPHARALKTTIDRHQDDRLYFQNAGLYPMHWNFAHEHLSGSGLPIVAEESAFNTTEYYSPDRRFVLGALTHYEGPDVWVYEIAPWDSADATMIASAFESVASAFVLGDDLAFHPTSESACVVATELPASVPVIQTEQLFEGTDYQPMHLGESYGLLRFVAAEDLETEYVSARDIIVLDADAEDISDVAGIITSGYQSVLSHLNVLSQNRGRPNMILQGAWDHEPLRDLEGRWVRLLVGAFDWEIEQVDAADADLWWDENGFRPVDLPPVDLTVTQARDLDDALDPGLDLSEAFNGAIGAFGGKAAFLGAITRLEDVAPVPDGIVVPFSWYWQFMQDAGLFAQASTMIEDTTFQSDPAVRDAMLASFRSDILSAPVDPGVVASLSTRIFDEYEDTDVRLLASTNAEYLDGFLGGALYGSNEWNAVTASEPLDDMLRDIWSSLWKFRGFDEMCLHSIDPLQVGIGIVILPALPAEGPNVLATTANPFDTSGLEPGFRLIAQLGGVPIVHPESGVIPDDFIYHWHMPGRPLVFLTHSSLVAEGDAVLSNAQLLALGTSLSAIHDLLEPVQPPDENGWRAVGLQVKFEAGSSDPLFVLARPVVGWSTEHPTCL